MNANDVYNVAAALPKDEQIRLLDMLTVSLKITTKPKTITKRKRKPLPNFTIDDGIRYLAENHFNKAKTP